MIPRVDEYLGDGPVRVHRNFTKGCWSIAEKRAGSWRIVAHADRVAVGAARFVVSEKGRARVLRERRKNVHAFVYGTARHWQERPRCLLDRVTYNPYRFAAFVRIRGEAVYDAGDAGLVLFGKDGQVRASR